MTSDLTDETSNKPSPPVRLTLTVDCVDRATADRVSKGFPSLDALRDEPGVVKVSAAYAVGGAP